MMTSEDEEEPGNALVSFVNERVLPWVGGKGQPENPLLDDVDLEEPAGGAEDEGEVHPSCTRGRMFRECVLGREITASVGVVLLVALVCGLVLLSVGHKLGSASGTGPAQERRGEGGGTLQIDIDILPKRAVPIEAPEQSASSPGPGPPGGVADEAAQ